MTLVFPLLHEPIQFEENRIQELIIENPPALRHCLEGLQSQIDGKAGEFVFAVHHVPQDLSRSAALLTDLFRPEVESRRLAGKIQQAALTAAEDPVQPPDSHHQPIKALPTCGAGIGHHLL